MDAFSLAMQVVVVLLQLDEQSLWTAHNQSCS
jgi:hypothetical protein